MEYIINSFNHFFYKTFFANKVFNIYMFYLIDGKYKQTVTLRVAVDCKLILDDKYCSHQHASKCFPKEYHCIIAISDLKSPRDGDFSILSPHGGLVVLRVGEDEEGDPQLVDLLQGQRVL